ncbi:hypothetical protein [Allostreptomyces psammosilenae]|uniref:Uncharacterized protein n=1 Tax=Allostreptomyces psammosilenae TaxID=1892865 RepID=A0A852ZQI8_9ACTN|nr:hypothetical protein [Allostreptomyces psammosilenae]NYI03757.1 hypothetical protein [Allostreptomyces psammosilenae]
MMITHPGNGATPADVRQRMLALGADLGITPGPHSLPARRCYLGPSAATLTTTDGLSYSMDPPIPADWRRAALHHGGASLAVITTTVPAAIPTHDELEGALSLDARSGRLMVGWCPVVTLG